MQYPKKTATYKACEQASMYGLPISRTTGGAKYTNKWKATRAWWNPEHAPKKRKAKSLKTLQTQK